MARHEFRTSVGGGVIDHRDRRPGILTIPNHRRQALLQQVSGVEIQDDDIDGWGGQLLSDWIRRVIGFGDLFDFGSDRILEAIGFRA